MYSPSLYLACALAITMHYHSGHSLAGALPVPAPAVAASIILPTVPQSQSSSSFLRRLTRRAIPTSSLRIIDDDASELDIIDMRDPRNWVDSPSPSAEPVSTGLHERSPSSSSPSTPSLFDDLLAQDASFLAPHLAPSLEANNNGVHASLAAALVVRQIEQREAQTPLDKSASIVARYRDHQEVVPASETPSMMMRR
ncbi:hypothetical protein JCM10908_002439 [Rhodotorula pacifica]|uniref:uncharacterized protein n=1 Tax=Rhodotorula pacifica TaxID=1495444 RepID=UPI003178C219